MPVFESLLDGLELDLDHIELINGAVETFLAAHSLDGAYRMTAKVTTEGRPLERRIRIALSSTADHPPKLLAQTSVPLRWVMGDGDRVDTALLQALHQGLLLRALSTTRFAQLSAQD